MAVEVAVPGDFLGFEEEVAGDQSTFVEDGKVFSRLAGRKEVSGGRAQISAKKTVRPVAAGDVVYGRVQDIYDSVSLIEIAAEPESKRISIGASYAFLRISELDRRYVNSFREYIRIGDVLRLKILEITPLGTYLTLNEAGLGVLSAYCSYCRTHLELKGRLLVCPSCGNREMRKIA